MMFLRWTVFNNDIFEWLLTPRPSSPLSRPIHPCFLELLDFWCFRWFGWARQLWTGDTHDPYRFQQMVLARVRPGSCKIVGSPPQIDIFWTRALLRLSWRGWTWRTWQPCRSHTASSETATREGEWCRMWECGEAWIQGWPGRWWGSGSWKDSGTFRSGCSGSTSKCQAWPWWPWWLLQQKPELGNESWKEMDNWVNFSTIFVLSDLWRDFFEKYHQERYFIAFYENPFWRCKPWRLGIALAKHCPCQIAKSPNCFLLLVSPPPELRVATGRRIGPTNDEEGKPIRVDSARPIHKLLQKQKASWVALVEEQWSSVSGVKSINHWNQLIKADRQKNLWEHEETCWRLRDRSPWPSKHIPASGCWRSLAEIRSWWANQNQPQSSDSVKLKEEKKYKWINNL